MVTSSTRSKAGTAPHGYGTDKRDQLHHFREPRASPWADGTSLSGSPRPANRSAPDSHIDQTRGKASVSSFLRAARRLVRGRCSFFMFGPSGAGGCRHGWSAAEPVEAYSAPAGPGVVATGGAQRNPWKRWCFPDSAPEGQRSRPRSRPLNGYKRCAIWLPRVARRRASPRRRSTRVYSPTPRWGV
jgi:hypothetical protein